jgi:hypothetical protein
MDLCSSIRVDLRKEQVAQGTTTKEILSSKGVCVVEMLQETFQFVEFQVLCKSRHATVKSVVDERIKTWPEYLLLSLQIVELFAFELERARRQVLAGMGHVIQMPLDNMIGPHYLPCYEIT